MEHYKLFVDGEFVEAADGATFQSIDPGTGMPFATVAKAGKPDAEAAIAAARRCVESRVWARLSPAERMEKLNLFADPLGALIIAEAAKAAGIPKGVINIIAGPGAELGQVLCTHPDVDKIAFTGSTEVGRQIMKMAADTVKKVTLELGGKSANIICEDADVDLAVEGAIFGTFFHQGQVCESGTRVLVAAKIHDAFVDKMKKRAESLRVGYQLDPATQQGPLVNATQLTTVERYVQLGKQEGAELVTGGCREELPGLESGLYFKPTIFANAKNSMRIAREEIFGPVVCVLKYDSEEEAVAIAKDSICGLAGGVFSRSNERAVRIAKQINTGTMWIDNYHALPPPWCWPVTDPWPRSTGKWSGSRPAAP